MKNLIGLYVKDYPATCTILDEKNNLYYFDGTRYTKNKYQYWNLNKFDAAYENTLSMSNFIMDLLVYYNIDKSQFSISKHDIEINDYMLFYEPIINKYKSRLGSINRYDHRFCHAASVYYTSNSHHSLIFVIDGSGDGTIGIYLGKNDKIELLEKCNNFSYGRIYNAVSKHVMDALNVSYANKDECSGKFMGYTAYGVLNSKLYDKIYSLLDNLYQDKSSIEVNGIQYKVSDLILNEFESIELKQASFTFQKAWIDHLIHFISKYSSISKDICVAGGCFLNCILNWNLFQSGLFDNIYFTPVPDDSGQSLGAVLAANKKHINFSPFIGAMAFDYKSIQYLKDKYQNRNTTLSEIAHLILDDCIVGVFRDKMEIGPRALGNRSILANPFNKNIKEILNNRVKHREWFRPFGAVVLEEDCEKYFDISGKFPYMNIVGYNKTSLFPGVTHIDNSTRVQTVCRSDNEWLYELLLEVKRTCGHGILLNTSFNIQGQPIINWYKDAIGMWKKGEIDYLLLEDNLFFDNKPPHATKHIYNSHEAEHSPKL